MIVMGIVIMMVTGDGDNSVTDFIRTETMLKKLSENQN